MLVRVALNRRQRRMKIALLLASIATSTTAANTTGRRTSIAFAKSKSYMHMSSSTQKQALISCPTTPLRDGTPHPVIGFGTYKVGFIPASASAAATDGVPKRTAEECVSDALDCGYRFLEWYVHNNLLLYISIGWYCKCLTTNNLYGLIS